MAKAAAGGQLRALYVVGSNPVARYNIDPFSLSQTFLVVQDMFLTDTATLADVVFPAACAYEKSGTMTNTCGDLQLVRKAGDYEGVKSDLEIIVNIADRMEFDVRTLVPFGRRGSHADLGQSRGVQSGEADRHAVWLAQHNLEPKTSPFDPAAVLDEIQRLVRGYDVSRADLLAGNDVHTSLVEVPRELPSHPELIVPSQDTLFTSGTLGRYSNALNQVIEQQLGLPDQKEPTEDIAAD